MRWTEKTVHVEKKVAHTVKTGYTLSDILRIFRVYASRIPLAEWTSFALCLFRVSSTASRALRRIHKTMSPYTTLWHFAPYTVLGTHSDSVHGILVGFLIYYNQKHTRTTINIQRSNSAAIEERLHCWLFNSLHELLSNPLQRDNGRVARRAGQRFKLLPLRTAIAKKKRSSVKIKMHSASLRS